MCRFELRISDISKSEQNTATSRKILSFCKMYKTDFQKFDQMSFSIILQEFIDNFLSTCHDMYNKR